MLKRILSVLIFTMLIALSAYSFEISKLPLNSKDIPSEIKYKGIFNYAFKYLDDTGENIIVYSSSNNNKIAELFVYRYLKSNKKFNLVWKIYDFAENPNEEMDLEAVFIEKSFIITDLDLNGVAEVWAMYRTAVRSDVSPSTLKIIMYHNKEKYAMRGDSKVQVGEEEYAGGEFKFDSAFKNGYPKFKKFAEKLWKDNYLE